MISNVFSEAMAATFIGCCLGLPSALVLQYLCMRLMKFKLDYWNAHYASILPWGVTCLAIWHADFGSRLLEPAFVSLGLHTQKDFREFVFVLLAAYIVQTAAYANILKHPESGLVGLKRASLLSLIQLVVLTVMVAVVAVTCLLFLATNLRRDIFDALL